MMGDPKRHSKKYQTPKQRWETNRIAEEKDLKREFGYKNKKELWKMDSILRKYRNQARRLIADRTEQGEKERKELLESLYRIGLLEKDAKLDNVLGLEIKNIMNRRLQTVIKRMGVANTVKHARQLINHGFVVIGDKVIKSPSYLVKREEESKIKVTGVKIGRKPE
jgi:small subunit ribosomal protein S4